MVNSPSQSRGPVLDWSITCNGTKLDSSFGLTYASVRMALNKIGKATLKFNAGDMDKQTFDQTDSPNFKPGSTIRLDVGDVNKLSTIFEGIIIKVGISIGNDFRSQMVVECRDVAYSSTLGRKNRIFEKKKDSEIIKEVLTDYGSVKVDATNHKHEEMVQYYCTDWDFALSRADASGLYILTQGNAINVFKPKVSASSVVTVTHGVDLINFEGGLTGSDIFTSYEAVSWNSVEQKQVKATATLPSLNIQGDLQPKSIASGESMLLQTDASTDENALKEWVGSLALKAGLSRYQGKFKFYGVDGVIPGCLVELKGLGKRFNGDVFIGSVTHTIEDNEWTIEAGMGVESGNVTDETDVVSPPASGFLPGLEGIHTAVVVQLDDDPQTEYRIKIELPWMDGKTKALWARFSSIYATNGSGAIFMPEKGDEVLVGFINQSPSHPVILGALLGSKHKPPYEHTSENNIKAIVTREKLIIEFDEEKKVITLRTPGKNMVEISDDGKSIVLKDQNSNKIVMDSDGISLSSSKDVKIKASGSITLDATSKVTISAKSDVALEALNVKIAAKVGFSAKGNATAELSASGQTVVKGAIVMIN